MTSIPVGATIFTRDKKEKGKVVSHTSRTCHEGCGGTRLGVRWPDGRLTYPCSRGIVGYRKNYRIG
jgi:hypothetical protein